MKHNPRKKEGIGLIEIIMSMAVISVLLIGSHLMMTMSMQNNKDSEIEQKAAMYGQQIFENFRSSEVTKTINDTGLKLSNGYELTGSGEYKTEPPMDLGNRYKGNITVEANSSGIGTVLNKQVEIKESYDFDVSLKKSGKVITIRDEDDSSKNSTVTDNYEESNTLTLVIFVSKTDTKKTITLKNEEGKELLSKIFEIDEIKKDRPIKLTMSFEDYRLSSSEGANLKMKVRSQDDKTINIICEKKPQNLFVSLEQYGEGEFTFYDEDASKDLYDIKVEITRDGKRVFFGTDSQNMKVIKDKG